MIFVYIIKRELHGNFLVLKTIFYSFAALICNILFLYHSKIKFVSSRRRVISSIYLPGQFHSAHELFSVGFPAQEIGAKTASGFMATQVLFRCRVPVPHVLVQSLHGLQRDHLDSTIRVKNILKRYGNSKMEGIPLIL